MCCREGTSLQRGMKFGLRGNHSVIMMSVRRSAPDPTGGKTGTALIYEGHDEPRSASAPNPKVLDPPARSASGSRRWRRPEGCHNLGRLENKPGALDNTLRDTFNSSLDVREFGALLTQNGKFHQAAQQFKAGSRRNIGRTGYKHPAKWELNWGRCRSGVCSIV
jgi:hypothetical protein